MTRRSLSSLLELPAHLQGEPSRSPLRLMPTRYSTATVPHAAHRQLRQHLRFVAVDRPAGAPRRRPDSGAHRRTDLRAPHMVKKVMRPPVIVLQEAAQSLLASHFAFAGSHRLFSHSKKQNIYFALIFSLDGSVRRTKSNSTSIPHLSIADISLRMDSDSGS